MCFQTVDITRSVPLTDATHRRRRKRVYRPWFVIVMLAVFGFASPVLSPEMARAEGLTEEAVEGPADRLTRDPISDIVRFTIGIRGGGGGEVWLKPRGGGLCEDGTVGDLCDWPMFSGVRGGWSGGAGLFVNAIFFEYVGIELGLRVMEHHLLEYVDWAYEELDPVSASVVRTEAQTAEEVVWQALHIPVLLKVYVPAETFRFTLGFGVDFGVTVGSKTSFETIGGTLAGPRTQFEELVADAVDSIYLLGTAGFEFLVGDGFFIPLELGVAYNVSQSSAYEERVSFDRRPATAIDAVTTQPTRMTIETRQSLMTHLHLGVGYMF
jgi:hypothetical protein